MEPEKERETILVPVRRYEAIPEKELPLEPLNPSQVEVPEMPKRWYVY